MGIHWTSSLQWRQPHHTVPPPQKIFRFLSSKRRVLVHLWCYFLQLINLNLHIQIAKTFMSKNSVPWMPEFPIPSARILLVSQIQGGRLPPPCPSVRYDLSLSLSKCTCNRRSETKKSQSRLTMTRWTRRSLSQTEISPETCSKCSPLNCTKRVFRCRSSTGRLFHSRGPAAVKLLSPTCDCVRGTARADVRWPEMSKSHLSDELTVVRYSCDFLLVINSKLVTLALSLTVSEIRRLIGWKSPIFPTHLCSTPNLKMFPLH